MPEVYGYGGNAHRRIVNAVKTVEGKSNGSLDLSQNNNADQTIIAKLTSRDGTDTWKYGWEQWRKTATGYEIIPEGLTGTLTDRWAVDMGADGDRFDLTNAIVKLVRSFYKDTDGTTKGCWIINHDLESVGQYIHQVKQTVAQGRMGHDYARAHSM